MPAFSWSGSPDNVEGMNYSTIFGYVMMVCAITHIWVALPACNYGDPLLTYAEHRNCIILGGKIVVGIVSD